jgi:hypothetical protein
MKDPSILFLSGVSKDIDKIRLFWPRGLSLIRPSHMSEIVVKLKASMSPAAWFSLSYIVFQIVAVKGHSIHN